MLENEINKIVERCNALSLDYKSAFFAPASLRNWG